MTKFSGEQPPSAENEKIRVSRLHFLIHPGFDADPNHSYRQGKTADYSLPNKAQLDSLQETGEKYLSAARNMGLDEIMVAFSHAAPAELKEDITKGQAYPKILYELKDILKNRLVVLSAEFPIQAWKEATGKEAAARSFQKIIQILKARGYELTKETEAQSFGEYVNACVPLSTINLNLARPFTKPVEMNKKLSK